MLDGVKCILQFFLYPPIVDLTTNTLGMISGDEREFEAVRLMMKDPFFFYSIIKNCMDGRAHECSVRYLLLI